MPGGHGQPFAAACGFNPVSVRDSFGGQYGFSGLKLVFITADDKPEYPFKYHEDFVFGVVDVKGRGITVGCMMFQYRYMICVVITGYPDFYKRIQEPKAMCFHRMWVV